MMLKRFMFMLFALLLTVSSALAQAIAPRCRVCGRKLTECPYKGNHAKKQSEGKKPAEKKKPKKKAPEKKPNHKAEPVKQSAATPTYYGYRIMDDGTVDVYRSEGLIKYLNEKTPATSLKLTGNFGYNGLKALRNHSFETLDLSDVWVTDSYEESNAKDHIHGAGFHLQWVDGIKADTLILPNDITILETAALGYTIKNLYIGKDVKVINFIEADLSNYNLPKDLHESMLENIFVDKENKDFKSIDGVLFNADGSELIMFPAGKDCLEEQSYDITSKVKKIADYAFFNSKKLDIDIPDNVQEIGYYAFAYSKIKDFSLGYDVQTINDGAFLHCDNLEFFEFNYELKKIPTHIFEYCPELAEVAFPYGMPSGKLPADVFRFSKRLNAIVIGCQRNKNKFKIFDSELANYLRNIHYNCQYPLQIVLHNDQDVKRYKKVFNDKRKFNIRPW